MQIRWYFNNRANIIFNKNIYQGNGRVEKIYNNISIVVDETSYNYIKKKKKNK